MPSAKSSVAAAASVALNKWALGRSNGAISYVGWGWGWRRPGKSSRVRRYQWWERLWSTTIFDSCSSSVYKMGPIIIQPFKKCITSHLGDRHSFENCTCPQTWVRAAPLLPYKGKITLSALTDMFLKPKCQPQMNKSASWQHALSSIKKLRHS